MTQTLWNQDVNDIVRWVTAAHDAIDRWAPRDRLDRDAYEHRIRTVRDIARTLRSWHPNPAELTMMGRLAWRNAARCVGRQYWQSLRVFDCRDVDLTADAIADGCVEHLRWSTNGGRIRPALSVFTGVDADGDGWRILNRQLIGYAGYRRGDTIVGDPAGVAITDLAQRLGWRGAGGPFDVLPLLVHDPWRNRTSLHPIPDDAVLRVPITHPDYRWFGDLGLQWYALPAVADMQLTGWGQRYRAAPFSGWYQGTEIGARDLADPGRYNQLPIIASLLGLDTRDNRTLWRDRALVELNRAVLHSFDEAGVRMSDHHAEAAGFVRFVDAAEATGCPVTADWSWVVPPISSAATPVFHRYYRDPSELGDDEPQFVAGG